MTTTVPDAGEPAGTLLAAESCVSEGDPDGVVAAWRASRPEQTRDAERVLWAVLLARAGAFAEAREAIVRVADAAERARLELLLADDSGESTLADPSTTNGFDAFAELDELDGELSTGAERAEDAGVCQEFLRWFGGRRDLYSRQWYDEHRRRSGYRPVREPLTENVVRQHLEGRITVGQYLLFPDATVSFAVIDLDVDASALAELRAGRSPEASALEHSALRGYLSRLIDAGARLGVPLFAEDSGGRGAHAWVFFAGRKPARAARVLLSQIAQAAGPPPASVNLEIFPKQERLGPFGLSSLVKLPLGLHQVTLRRCQLLDDQLRAIDDVAAALARLRTVEPERADAIVGRRLLALPAPEREDVEPLPLPPQAPTARSLAEALRALRDGDEAKTAAERMLEGCRILASIVHQAYTERRLSPDEARSITYTLGLVGSRSELADDVLRAANASLKELERARRGLPSPTGCARLRRLARPGVDCTGCQQPPGATPYGSPALFAVGVVRPAPPHRPAFAPWADAEDLVVETPFEALGQVLRRIERKLEQLESDHGGGPEDQ